MLCSNPRPLAAQAISKKPTLHVRIGAFMATPLVKDEVGSRALDDSIAGDQSNEVTLTQEIAPIGSVAVRFPMRGTTHVELAASVARSPISGDDGFETWDMTTATMGNVIVSFGYLYRRRITLRGGVGLTKLFAEKRGIFSAGNPMKPVVEGGAAAGLGLAGRPFEIDFRVQSHSFATATMRESGGSAGNVTRFVLQFGTAIWQPGQ